MAIALDRRGNHGLGAVAARHGTIAVWAEPKERDHSPARGCNESSLAGPLSTQLAVTISTIWALVDECAEIGWDGNDGAVVSETTARGATDFILALPEQFPLPEVAPEPDGAISLDWIRSRNRIFSLSIGESHRLPYAWLDGAEAGHNVADFDGHTVPQAIIDGIQRAMR